MDGRRLAAFLRRLSGATPDEEGKGEALARAVAEARREWQLALRYFESLEDPELIEHAAYLVKATERRYVALLRKVRARHGGLEGDEGISGGARA